ncbi:SDR family NAD(P)-dependent oxidoreductase [Streptosporangium sp. CA-135522]|uniref:SDR family NAD(P)-dependent oxidoreductase n=1 Tax=Streptosporangium sp. CA-135522 TaxID=3240072 RepID=UPI003D8C9214
MGVLDGKVAVVTGGTSGIGARTATLFAAEGARVVIAGRRTEEGEKLAAEFGGTFVRTDVSVEADVEALIAHAVERYGRLDVLVNNAGDPGAGGSVADADLARFEQTFAVHLGGVLTGMKYASRVMLGQESGSIINIASTTARLGGWAGLGYSAAKAAVIQLTRGAAVELGEHGIRVNSISPGPILTGIFAKGAGMDAAEADRTAAAMESAFTAALEIYQPIHRAGTPDDVAQAALWLAGDGSAFVNGHDLAVDGGISAGRPASVALAERAKLAKAFADLRG